MFALTKETWRVLDEALGDCLLHVSWKEHSFGIQITTVEPNVGVMVLHLRFRFFSSLRAPTSPLHTMIKLERTVFVTSQEDI